LLILIWPVISHSFTLDITLGHQIFMIYRKHLFTKDWSFLWISHVTSQVWHPYSSTDFTYTLNSFIFVYIMCQPYFPQSHMIPILSRLSAVHIHITCFSEINLNPVLPHPS
jgi:hypothetical protein